MDKLDNKNWTKEEALGKLRTPDKKKRKNKRVYPGFPDTGLKTGPKHPLILRLGGYTNEKKLI